MGTAMTLYGGLLVLMNMAMLIHGQGPPPEPDFICRPPSDDLNTFHDPVSFIDVHPNDESNITGVECNYTCSPGYVTQNGYFWYTKFCLNPQDGWEYVSDHDGDVCSVDINECDEYENETLCDDTSYCHNLIGWYTCLCKRGFVKSEDGETWCKPVECPVPERLPWSENEKMWMEGPKFGDQIWHYCQDGYEAVYKGGPSGPYEESEESEEEEEDGYEEDGDFYGTGALISSYIVKGWCNADGQWEVNGRCERIDCGHPAERKNARSLGGFTKMGDSFIYECKDGYFYPGTSPLYGYPTDRFEIYCGLNGWTPGDCEDIDECEAGDPCDDDEECENTSGSFECEGEDDDDKKPEPCDIFDQLFLCGYGSCELDPYGYPYCDCESPYDGPLCYPDGPEKGGDLGIILGSIGLGLSVLCLLILIIYFICVCERASYKSRKKEQKETVVVQPPPTYAPQSVYGFTGTGFGSQPFNGVRFLR